MVADAKRWPKTEGDIAVIIRYYGTELVYTGNFLPTAMIGAVKLPRQRLRSRRNDDPERTPQVTYVTDT
jgi:hypothetical protein